MSRSDNSLSGSAIASADRQWLGLLLNLEYLQAEFYLRASTGDGLPPDDRGHSSARCGGGRKVHFENGSVAAAVAEFARIEHQHVRALRSLLMDAGEEVCCAPAIDLAVSFDAIMRASGLNPTGRIFDPFFNDTNFLMSAYYIEDLVVSSYCAALRTLSNKASIARLAGIMAAEATQSGFIRTILFMTGFGDQTNALSVYRQKLSNVAGTPFAGNDHGVGDATIAGVINAESQGSIWARSDTQLLGAFYGGVELCSGLFFPEGISEGPEDACLQEIYLGHLLQLSRARATPTTAVAALVSETVEMPPLALDEVQLGTLSLEENIAHQPWHQTSYISQAPTVFEICDAVSFGAVGILAVDDRVVHETLWHTDPARHHYTRADGAVTLRHGKEEFLPGTTVSILVGAAESYFHALIDSAARLTTVPDEVWQRTDTLLIPSTGIRQREIVELFRPPAQVAVRSVDPEETLRCERLIYPASIHGLLDYHPTPLNRIYERLLSHTPFNDSATPHLLFVDRRGSPLRRLLNEDDVIAALPAFEPVALERLTLAEQVRLFHNADVVVGPHGAGLSNIGFCRPGAIVVELMMDRYSFWCYRRIAAVRQLTYRCVLGRASADDASGQSVHLQTWTVPVDEVVATVNEAMNQTSGTSLP